MPNNLGRPNHAHHDDDDDRYFDLEGLAYYSGLSLSSLRRFLKDATHPLPHSRITTAGRGRGRILIRKRAFDEWVERFAAAKLHDTQPTPAKVIDVSWIRERD